MGKRFLFYLNGISKPITITDRNEKRPIKELVDEISDLISSSPIAYFATECDGILLRSSEISSVCITNIEKNLKKKEPKEINFSDDKEEDKTSDLDLLDNIPDIEYSEENVKMEREIDELFDIEEDEVEDLLDEETLKEIEKEEDLSNEETLKEIDNIYNEQPKEKSNKIEPPKARITKRVNSSKKEIDRLPGVVPVRRMHMPPPVKTEPAPIEHGSSLQQHDISEIKNKNMGGRLI